MPFLRTRGVESQVRSWLPDREAYRANGDTKDKGQGQVRGQKGEEVTTRAEAMNATDIAREQRLSLLPLLRADASKAAPGDVETCKKALALSMSEPMKFDAALPHPITAKLFACGALYFGKAA